MSALLQEMCEIRTFIWDNKIEFLSRKVIRQHLISLHKLEEPQTKLAWLHFHQTIWL